MEGEEFNALIKERVTPVLEKMGIAWASDQEKGRVVNFSHEALKISFAYNRLSFMAEVMLRFSGTEEAFGFDEWRSTLAGAYGPGKGWAAKDKPALISWLNQLLPLLEKHLPQALEHPQDTHHTLAQARRHHTAAYNENLQYSFFKERFLKCWKAKDYEGAVREANEYGKELEGAMQKKLAYAQKQLKK